MTLARQLCPMKHISASVSGFAFRSIVFGAPVCFWALWLFESLYISLNTLILYTLVHGHGYEKECPKLCRCDFFDAGALVCVMHKLVQLRSQWGQKISCLALILVVSNGNVKECYISNLFPGLTGSVIEPSGVFCNKKSTYNAILGCIMTFGVFLSCFMRQVVEK